MYYILFIQLCVSSHMGYFPPLALVHSTAVNMSAALGDLSSDMICFGFVQKMRYSGWTLSPLLGGAVTLFLLCS